MQTMQGIWIFQRYIWRFWTQQYTVWLYSQIKLLLGLYSKSQDLSEQNNLGTITHQASPASLPVCMFQYFDDNLYI